MLAGTSPFDSDTDDDGIKDPEDPTPLHPGILTSDEQKLKIISIWIWNMILRFCILGAQTKLILSTFVLVLRM